MHRPLATGAHQTIDVLQDQVLGGFEATFAVSERGAAGGTNLRATLGTEVKHVGVAESPLYRGSLLQGDVPHA